MNRPTRPLAPLTLALMLAACTGDDSATTDTVGTDVTSNSGTTTAGSTSVGTTSAGTTSAGTTTDTNSGTATMGSSSSGETDPSTSEASVTDTDATTDPTTSTTGPDCVCTPGEPSGACEGDDLLVCADDCINYVPAPCDAGQVCQDGACIALLCTPNQIACADDNNLQTCSEDGLEWLPPVPCGDKEACSAGACVNLCDLVQENPSSIGCSFIANRMDNYYSNENDSVVVGNISKSKTAAVQLYLTPTNSNVEQAQGAAVNIPPGGTTTFTLTNATIDKISALRVGGSYRIQSDLPVIAYQHSPLGQIFTNDASMLLPEYALKQNYIVASWRDALGSYPSYFNVVATQPGTTVKWTPPIATNAGAGVPAVAANATGQVTMNRADTLQVRVANNLDISGTIIEADKPIWVVGATECTNVPNSSCLYCDHVEDMMLPLDYWGKEYVGAPSPKRGNEKHHWRIFAGEDNTTVTTEPAQPGTPIVLAKKGQFKDIVIPNSVAFVFKSDQPFMPVQYLESQTCGAGTGDPAMYQMIPVEQFLPSYAFATGTGNYPLNYVQIIRQKGGADVTVDGVVVTGYYTIGNYEVADWKINLGSHFAESEQAFGIVGVGYSDATSYAYPGGLKLAVINPQ
ncbi:MAG: IgGFc-binding protein [Nannocystis sp.]|nr:IgGFc-binding protein [Nannocystis sp.]